MENIKYAYLRDPKNKHRVVTIARAVNKEAGTISFSLAVNRCVDSHVTDYSYCKVIHDPSAVDKFDKQRARLITSKKLEGGACTTIPLEDCAPHLSILRYLATKSEQTFTRRTCAFYYCVPKQKLDLSRKIA